jgi:predicted nucleic-acid-binding protein
MIAADTNLLLRFFVKDNDAQTKAVTRWLAERTADDPVFVSMIVLCELAWVLRRRYCYPPDRVRELLIAMLETEEFVFEDEAAISAILASGRKTDFPDEIIAYISRRAGCRVTMTFDQEAAARVPSMELLS